MSQDTVYISAAETGLVKWNEFRKPPYSTQDYLDAYNNGQRMTAAFNQAHANGASKVILERGNYPFCYVNKEKAVANLTPNNVIENTTDFEIDGNGSVVFAIFDSVNRSPYHTGSAAQYQAPYQLSGCLFWLQHNTNLYFHGFNLRGDQYMRSWVTGEKDTEQTYGVILSLNNYNTKVDFVGHGFRGDAISSKNPNSKFFNLTGGYQNGDWLKGGVDNAGLPIEEVGSYRTPVIDLRNVVIYRNAVQLVTFGGQGHPTFRDDNLKAFFFDLNGAFISSEYVWAFEPIVLPSNCGYLRLVAYGDERTDEKVGYGTYLYLGTGCSNVCEVKGEFYANHRGAVSNLCNNTTLDADIHDNGTNKYGFPTYYSTTRYGVNFEDVIVGKLTVRGSIRNGGTAIMANTRDLIVDGCNIKNMLYGGIAAAATRNAVITNSTFTNVKILFNIAENRDYARRVIDFNNNIVKQCPLYGTYPEDDKLLLTFRNNKFYDGIVAFKGNGSNLIFTDNQIINPIHSGSGGTVTIRGALRCHNNSIVVGSNSIITDNREFTLLGKNFHSNLLLFTKVNPIFIAEATSGQVTTLKGLDIESSSVRNMIGLLSKASAAEGEVFKTMIDNCNFRNGNILIGNYSNVDLCDSITTIQNCTFSQNENILDHFIDLSIRGSLGIGTHKLYFKNCTFNLTDVTKYIMDTPIPIVGTMDIVFSDCTFSADTPQADRLKIFKRKPTLTNITARALDCRFINVKP